MDTRTIPHGQIDASGFNSRVTAFEENEIADLAKNIDAVGLMNPLTVCEKEGGKGYTLVCGFRRYAALSKLIKDTASTDSGAGYLEVPCRVYPPLTKQQIIVLNLSENLARKDLNTYETARACAALEDSGMKGDDIAEKLAFASRSHVNNLLRAFKNLIAKIRDAWERGLGFCTTTWLFECAALTPDEQTTRYEQATGQTGKGNDGSGKPEGEKGEKGKEKGKPKLAKLEDIERAFAQAREASKSLSGSKLDKLLSSLFAFVKGESRTFLTIDLDAEKASAKDKKDKEKLEEEMKKAKERLDALKKDGVAALKKAKPAKPATA